MIFQEVWIETLRSERKVAHSRRRQEHDRHLEDAIAATKRADHAAFSVLQRAWSVLTARPRHQPTPADGLAQGEGPGQDDHAALITPEHALGASRS